MSSISMDPTVTVLASGLKLLSYQGITVFRGVPIIATVEADLIQVGPDGTLTPWINVARYGIPTGIVGLKDSLIVALSGQESGHFLIRVTKQGQILPLVDLSALAGEFGLPFAVAAREAYYPYYMVAISTDVSGSAGLIAWVTPAGRARVLATLPASPFGVGIGNDYVIATQENGQVLKISLTGQISVIADVVQAQLGIPLDITRFNEDWMITTTTGWLVALKPDETLVPVVNLAETGNGSPTTLTAFDQRLIIATQFGKLLQIEVEEA